MKTKPEYVGIGKLETVQRGGKTFVVNPYTRELRPCKPIKNGYCFISYDVHRLLESGKQRLRKQKPSLSYSLQELEFFTGKINKHLKNRLTVPGFAWLELRRIMNELTSQIPR